MDKLPLMVLIFYSIPESILIFTYGQILLGYSLKIRPILLASVISAVASYFARLLPAPYGVHTLIGLFIIFILFKLMCKLPTKQSFIASAVSLGTLLALDNSIFYFVQIIFKITLQDLLHQTPLMRLLFLYPVIIVWALITLFIYKKKLSLGGMLNESGNRKQNS